MADVNVWYNSKTGYVATDEGFNKWFNEHSGLDKLNAAYFGWHGPFKSKEEAYQFYTDNKSAHPDWTAPTDDAYKAFAQTAGGAVTDAIGLSNGGIVNAGNWVIRIAEIVLGVVLIGVGVAKLTGATNAIAKIARVTP